MMSRRLGVGWRGARFGLTLNRLGTMVIAYTFFLNAAVTVGLVPLVFSQQYHGMAGFAVASIIGALYLGSVKRSLQIDADYLKWQLFFVACSVAVCISAFVFLARLEQVLNAARSITTPALYAAIGMLLAGFLCCITAWGSLFTWLSAAAALVTLAGALSFMLVSSGVDSWIPDALRGSALISSPVLSAVGLACLAIYIHGRYLRHVAAPLQRCVDGRLRR